jgi:hypothetical protein
MNKILSYIHKINFCEVSGILDWQSTEKWRQVYLKGFQMSLLFIIFKYFFSEYLWYNVHLTM